MSLKNTELKISHSLHDSLIVSPYGTLFKWTVMNLKELNGAAYIEIRKIKELNVVNR